MGLTWYVGGATVVIVAETVLIVWLLRHRAAGSRTRHLLKERLQFEAVLADVSAKLIHVEGRGLEAAVGAALQQAVTFLGMDRGSLDEYVDGASAARISWEPLAQDRVCHICSLPSPECFCFLVYGPHWPELPSPLSRSGYSWRGQGIP